MAQTIQELYKRGQELLQKSSAITGVQPVTPLKPSPISQEGMVGAEQLSAPAAAQMPEPQADQAAETQQLSLQGQVDTATTALQDTLKTERDAALKRQDELNQKLQAIQKESDPTKRETYKQEQRILQNQLNAAETASAALEGQFNDRLKITNELDQLLTEGNNLIAQKKNLPISIASLNKIQNRTIQDVQARAGVLSAVVSAIDGNITQAHNIINTAQGTVRTYWQDQLDYNNAYMALVEAGELAKNEIHTEYADAQIKLAEDKLSSLQETADYIQELMIDPETAQFMADAGVTLNDSVDEINTKMAEQNKKQEREETINTLKMEGYEYVPFPGDREDVVTLEVGGKTLAFVPPVEGVNEAVSNALLAGATPEEAALLSDRLVSDEDKLELANSIIARAATEERNLDIEGKRASNAASWALANQRLEGGETFITPVGPVQVPTFEEWAEENGGRVWQVGGTQEEMDALRKEYDDEVSVMDQAARVAALSPLAREVVNNPQAYYDFTATQKGEIFEELSKAGLDTNNIIAGKKKTLPATQVESISQGLGVKADVEKLYTMLKELDGTGPISGRLQALDPWHPKRVAIEAQITRIVPGLARGIFNEVGVLTDQDVERYRNTLANPNMTDEQIEQLHKDTLSKIDQSLASTIETFGLAGYDTSKFKVPTDELPEGSSSDADPLGLNIPE